MEFGWNQLDFGMALKSGIQRMRGTGLHVMARLFRNPRIRCRFGTLTVPGVRVTAIEETSVEQKKITVKANRNCFRKHLNYIESY